MPVSSATAPLAHRVRPKTLEEFAGQEHVLGIDTPLRAAIERDALTSVILSGPPGTGKTTLARIIAERTHARFVQLNAVLSGVKDLKAVCAEAEGAGRTLLFIDEIHRFNKSQQDALLPYVEKGTVILIGATTENPYFEVNKALLSRSHVALLNPLSVPDIVTILKNALSHPDGYDHTVTVSDDALMHLARIANGDARIALNALELSLATLGTSLTLKQAEKLFGKRRERYDASGEDHYDVISAFIKTLRGSDPDAALLWMYRMLESGEEPRFLFRRMAIFASEDIGHADPFALQRVISAWQAFEFVGLPEGEYFLAYACIYLAQAPKSNAIKRAMMSSKKAMQSASSLEVPNHLRNAPVKAMKQHGRSVEYHYPHDDPRGVVTASYFPVGFASQNFYEPTMHGFEAEVCERLEKVRKIVRGG